LLDNTRATASSPVCGDYGAVLAAIKDAARRAKRGGLRPSLTAAARDALGKRRSGRQDGLQSNNRMGRALTGPSRWAAKSRVAAEDLALLAKTTSMAEG